MSVDRIPLKISDQIILHLLNFGGFKEKYKVPFQVSQAGIAKILCAHRSHISYYLKKMEKGKILTSRLGRIQGLPRKRKVYFLTEKGKMRGQEIMGEVVKNGIRFKGPGKDLVIEINDDIFNSPKTSYLEKLIEKVGTEVAADVESSERTLNYILDGLPREVDPAYIAILAKRNLKSIQKAIDKGDVITVSSKDAPELLDAYVSALAQELSKICNIFVYNLHRFSTLEDVVSRFSLFLGKMGNYSMQEISRTDPERAVDVIPNVVQELPFVIMVSGEWCDRTRSRLEKGLMKLMDNEIPLIIATNDGEVLKWFNKKDIHIPLKPLARSVAMDIYKEILGNNEDRLSDRAKKRLFKESGSSPLLLEQVARTDDREMIEDFLSHENDLYSAKLDGMEQELLDVLTAMAEVSYPILREQLNDEVSSCMIRLAEEFFIYTAPSGFYLPRALKELLKERYKDDIRMGKAREFYRKIQFLSPHQALDAAALHRDTNELSDGLGMACDWSTILMEIPELPSMASLFSELDRGDLSKEDSSVFTILNGFEELRKGNLKAARELSDDATKEGGKLKNERILARSFFLQGKIILMEGEIKKGLENMVTSFNLYRGLENIMGSSFSALAISEIFEEMGQLNKALSYIDIAVEPDKAMLSASLISQVYAKRGELYHKKNIFSKASASLGEAIEMTLKFSNKREALSYELKKGDVLVEEGHIKDAISTFEKVAEEAAKCGYGELQLKGYEGLYKKCFKAGTSRYGKYKAKAGPVRVLLKGATRMTRKR